MRSSLFVFAVVLCACAAYNDFIPLNDRNPCFSCNKIMTRTEGIRRQCGGKYGMTSRKDSDYFISRVSSYPW